MPLKLVAVDLDGTLLTREGKPAPQGLEMLRTVSRSGIRVVFATARRYLPSDELYSQLGFPDPLICWDGGEIYHSFQRQIWQRNPIPLDVARLILEFADREHLEITVGYSERLYWKQRPDQSGPPPSGITVTESYTETLDDAPLRLLTGDSRSIMSLSEFCTHLPVGSCRVQSYVGSDGRIQSLGIFSSEADKGKELAFVCSGLGISLSEVMAIGDNLSDQPMLVAVGVSVAVGNACEELKVIADVIAPSNDDEGVAWALRQHFEVDTP